MARRPLPLGTAKLAAPELLRPHPKNDNKQSAFMFGKLLATIQSEGFSQPIVVRSGDANGPFKGVPPFEILGGEQRWRAAQQLKMSQVPIWDLGDVDDLRAEKLIINLNKLHGDPDQDALSKLMRSIVAQGGEETLESLPFDQDTLKDLLDGDLPGLEAPSALEAEAQTEEALQVASVGVGVTPRDILVALEIVRLPKSDLEALLEAVRQWSFGRADLSVPAWQEMMEILKRETNVRS